MNKPPLTYVAQLQLLKDRGLTVDDEAYALHCLANYNYYRLSIYWRCFTDPTNHDRFHAGTTFEQIWQLYDFDRELRKLVNEACKRLEISARSRWAYELGQAYGCQAYEDPAAFSHVPAHTKLLAWFDDCFEASKEIFVQHYKTKPCHRPEIWVAIELLEFGKFCRFYRLTKQAQLRECIADHYHLNESSFSSLLTQCNYIRNICAHHSRLWNRRLTIKLSVPKKKPIPLAQALEHYPKSEEIESRKLYNTLTLLIHCVQVIEPRGDWPQRLVTHLQTLPANLIPHMGFPADWQTRPIWAAVH
ncbi:Abi family protein [Coraliomargarita algicola]|uniref:Abi family protein n=1 Tax=Coraliomargarita algicola TaxID=3092156 RepID=A0ABZ0RRB9_9BACT|nr:Abi family protein [Coraliomargarita sp. J2-16]WPJ97525.1 Abi family protein [Coraliomargarita sp. J2-16]